MSSFGIVTKLSETSSSPSSSCCDLKHKVFFIWHIFDYANCSFYSNSSLGNLFALQSIVKKVNLSSVEICVNKQSCTQHAMEFHLSPNDILKLLCMFIRKHHSEIKSNRHGNRFPTRVTTIESSLSIERHMLLALSEI